MKARIEGNPDYGEVSVELGAGEQFYSEGGAMSRMDPSLELKGRLLGGFFKSIIRKFLGGESMFISEYTAPTGGKLSLSPSHPGSVLHRSMKGDTFLLTAGSYLASTKDVSFQTRFGGLKAFFSGEGAFFLECSGTGDLYFTAFGGLVEKEIDGAYTVDTGHLVAWETSLEWTIGGMGSLKSTLLSGEGLVIKFTGKGKVYLQTRTLSGLGGWISPYLRG